MKSFREMLDGLNEAKDNTQIQVGSKLKAVDGTDIEITDIIVYGLHLKTQSISVGYKYKTASGKSGKEVVSLENFIRNIS